MLKRLVEKLKAAICQSKFQRWVSWFRSPTAEEIVREFAEAFPGKCFICSYHRYGIEHGLTSKPLGEHDCIDEKTN